jgi:hypothetical protein
MTTILVVFAVVMVILAFLAWSLFRGLYRT